MKILVTGADGFIGKNLAVVLGERGHEMLPVTRGTDEAGVAAAAAAADAVVTLPVSIGPRMRRNSRRATRISLRACATCCVQPGARFR